MRAAYALAALLALSGCRSAEPKPESAAPSAQWLVEDFEGSAGRSGFWNVAANDNGLGTRVTPMPFAPQAGGSPLSPGFSGRIHGWLGPNRPPYSWAQLSLALTQDGSPKDLGDFKSLRFWVKGDGRRHVVKLMKASVTDHDQYKFAFPASKAWTELAIPLDAFTQAGWGKALPRVFDDVKSIQFDAGVHDSAFDFQVDDVRLSGESASLEPEAYDTTGWFPYQGFEPAQRKGTALDASRRLDAPAGKHGWVAPKGEDFVFVKNGKKVRFFGTNLVAGANFPTHEQAESLAEALAQMGVNMTRHHHADAPWATTNFFGKADGTRKLDPEAMDRFDYLVAQLQKRGIYQYFDLLVHRPPLAADGVQANGDLINGWKIEGEFDPHLISLQEEFTRQFLGHKNPYTGKKYGQDPAVAALEIINEDSLWFRGSQGDFSITSPYYKGVYQGLFNKWLKTKYKDRAALARAWASDNVDQQGLGDDEDLANGSVKALESWDKAVAQAVSTGRRKDAWAFDGYLMESYFGRMLKVVRAMGYQGPVTGSNHWITHPADLALNARLGYIDRHAYWGHPQGGWDYSRNVTFDPNPLLRHPEAGIVGELAARRVKGLPFIATEWGSSAPNDYRGDGVLTMGIASSLQNWSATQFAFSHTDKADFATFKGTLSSFFDSIYQPVWMTLWPAVATMVQRGDIAPDDGPGAWTAFSRAELDDPDLQRQGSGAAAFAARTGVVFGAASGPSPDEARAEATRNGWVVSPGNQVRHNPEAGLLLVDTDRSKAVAGFAAEAGELQTGSLKVKLSNTYAVLLLTSLDDKVLEESGRALLVAGGNAVNTGMVKRWGGGAIHDPGTSPVLVEPVLGKVSLACNGPRKVYALDNHGRRGAEVPSTYSDGALRFELAAGHQSLAWELVAP